MTKSDTSHISFTYPPAATMWVITLHYLLCTRTHPYPVTHHPIGSGYFRAKPSPVWIPQQFSNLVILHLLAYEDGTVCSETSAYKIQTPGNYPEENIQHTEHGESLKSRKGGRCVGLTTLPPSCADCLEIWEPQTPGTLWVCNKPA